MPRESHSPGRPDSAVPCQVQSSPSALVAYSVLIWSVSSGSASGWIVAHMCHCPPWRWITGSLTARLRGSPGSTTSRVRTSSSAGWAASMTSTRQCLVPVVAQLRYSRQRPSGSWTSSGRSSDSVSASSLAMTLIGSSKCTPSGEKAIATA